MSLTFQILSHPNSPNTFLIEATSSIFHKTLSNIIHQHSSFTNSNPIQPQSPFTSQSPSYIPINTYLTRIITFTQIELNTLITSLIYLDRYLLKTNTTLTNSNIHRLLICSILLSIKYNEDTIFQMNYYAQIFGVSLKELRKLERAFVTKMGFDFYVNDELFEQYKGYISIELKELIKQHKEKGKVIEEEREEIKMFT